MKLSLLLNDVENFPLWTEEIFKKMEVLLRRISLCMEPESFSLIIQKFPAAPDHWSAREFNCLCEEFRMKNFDTITILSTLSREMS